MLDGLNFDHRPIAIYKMDKTNGGEDLVASVGGTKAEVVFESKEDGDPPKKKQKVRKPRVSLLAELNEQKVMVVTFDGRTMVGTMRGFDQVCNIIIEKTVERVFEQGSIPKEVDLGLFVVRGENVAFVGTVDEEKDAASNWQNVKVSSFHFPFCVLICLYELTICI